MQVTLDKLASSTEQLVIPFLKKLKFVVGGAIVMYKFDGF